MAKPNERHFVITTLVLRSAGPFIFLGSGKVERRFISLERHSSSSRKSSARIIDFPSSRLLCQISTCARAFSQFQFALTEMTTVPLAREQTYYPRALRFRQVRLTRLPLLMSAKSTTSCPCRMLPLPVIPINSLRGRKISQISVRRSSGSIIRSQTSCRHSSGMNTTKSRHLMPTRYSQAVEACQVLPPRPPNHREPR